MARDLDPSWSVDIHGRGPGVLVAVDGFKETLFLELFPNDPPLRETFPMPKPFKAAIGFVDAARRLRQDGTLMLHSTVDGRISGSRTIEFAPGEKEKFLVWLDSAFEAGFGAHHINRVLDPKGGHGPRTNSFQLFASSVKCEPRHLRPRSDVFIHLGFGKTTLVFEWTSVEGVVLVATVAADAVRRMLFAKPQLEFTAHALSQSAQVTFTLLSDDAQGLLVWLDTMEEQGHLRDLGADDAKPKIVKKLATSGSLEEMKKLIAQFYYSTPDRISYVDLGTHWQVRNGERVVTPIVVQQGKRFVFGTP